MYPSVLKEETGYRMWYASNSIRIPHTTSMATSPDGVRWTKYRDGAPLEGLGWYVTGPAVYRMGDEYLMLCSPEDLDMNLWIVRGGESRRGRLASAEQRQVRGPGGPRLAVQGQACGRGGLDASSVVGHSPRQRDVVLVHGECRPGKGISHRGRQDHV